MHRHNDRCASRVKGTEQILTAAAHGALAVTALDVDGVAPVAACGAQELTEVQIGGRKTGKSPAKYHAGKSKVLRKPDLA